MRAPTKSLEIRLAREVRRCKRDFIYFAEKYLYIQTKDGKLEKFKLNIIQKKIVSKILNDCEVDIFLLKSRQVGGTTLVAALYTWMAMFRPNFNVLVVAKTKPQAKKIFKIYRRYYRNLPSFFRTGVFKTESDSVTELTWAHGSSLLVTSSNSEEARGSTAQAVHLSEFATYNNVAATCAAILNAVPAGALVIRETTANGLNGAYRVWVNDAEVYKMFVPWTDNPEYASNKPVLSIPDCFKDYVDKYPWVTKRQLWWAIRTYHTRCAGSFHKFNQEYPVVSSIAFITSGDKYFDVLFPDTILDKNNIGDYLGYIEFVAPLKYHTYVAGVDTASGSSDGDFSAFVILDVTDKHHPIIVATYYDRVSLKEYSRASLKYISRYDALAVIERNSYGLTVIEHFVDNAYPNMYRRVKFDKVADRYTESLGFWTDAGSRNILMAGLQDSINNKYISIIDDRIKSEINTFVYKTTNTGKTKPQADSGSHDDILLALSLALRGVDQIENITITKKRDRPTNVKEVLEYESAYNTTYNPNSPEFADDRVDFFNSETNLSSILHG